MRVGRQQARHSQGSQPAHANGRDAQIMRPSKSTSVRRRQGPGGEMPLVAGRPELSTSYESPPLGTPPPGGFAPGTPRSAELRQGLRSARLPQKKVPEPLRDSDPLMLGLRPMTWGELRSPHTPLGVMGKCSCRQGEDVVDAGQTTAEQMRTPR